MNIDGFEFDGMTMESEQESRPRLLQHDHSSESSSPPLLHIEFETNPVHTDVDYRLQAMLQSMEIIYDAVFVLGIHSFDRSFRCL